MKIGWSSGLFFGFILIIGALSFPLVVSGDGEEDDHLPQWTFLVYLDADNNLEGAGIEDVNEMETVGSTDEVNIVVQFDRIDEYDTSNGDWKDTKRFLVTRDEDTQMINSIELEDLGEVNMGDPQSLVDFVMWGIDEFPAQKYALVLWNHGGAFYGVEYDDTSNDGEGDFISMWELGVAMEKISSDLGRKMDLVGFDACLMAQLGILYQIKDGADIAVASGYVEPGDGWPYDTILPQLAQDPEMDPEELGELISREYVESYTDMESDPDDSPAITQTAFRLEFIDELSQEVNEFAMVLSRGAFTHNLQIKGARTNAEGYDMANAGPFDFTGYALYDIIGIAQGIDDSVVFDREIKTQAKQVVQTYKKVVAASYADPLHPDANGLTIYFPSTDDNTFVPGRTEYDERYDNLTFAQEKYWDDFLRWYLKPANAPNTPPTVSMQFPREGEQFESKDGSVLVTGTAFDADELSKVEISIDGETWEPVGGATGEIEVSWAYELDIQELHGKKVIQVRAADNDGEVSNIETAQIEIQGSDDGGSGITTSVILTTILLLVVAAIVGFIIFQRFHRRAGRPGD